MSLAEYASRPFPLLVKLANLLRDIRSAIFRLGALPRRDEGTEKSLAANFDRTAADIVCPSSGAAVTLAETTPLSEREQLIRRRWAETGIRMWNARVHGTGAPLNIQGSVELLPPNPGETVRRYDKLQFRLLGGQIVCEGVIVDPPSSERVGGLRN